MKGVVLIAGRGFCGSTVLSRAFNVVPKVVSLGETHWLVDKKGDKGYCTVHKDCARIERVRRRKPTHTTLAELLAKEFSEADWLVSSDKNPTRFSRFYPREQTRVVIMFKNPLAFAASDQHNRAKLSVQESVNLFIHSYQDCLRAAQYFDKVSFLSLEHFVHEPQFQLARICKELKLPNPPDSWDFSSIEHHNIGGNGAARRSQQLYLDVRWVKELSMEEKLFVATHSAVQRLYMRLLERV